MFFAFEIVVTRATFFEENTILLFAWDSIYFKLNFPRISEHLDIVSKFLKIFIQFFIGYPNTCTWCGIHGVICSWLYELLMILKSNISKTSARVSWGFQTRETFWTTRPQAEWFFCFRAFGNLMKPEARVFEITSPTKKIIIWISFHNSAILFETWNVPAPQVPHLMGPLQFTITWYKNRHAGEQTAHWDIQNKAT